MAYVAPVDDIMHALKTAAGIEALIADGTVTTDLDTVRAVIEEAGKFGAEVLDPLNWSGDQQGSKLVDGVVHIGQLPVIPAFAGMTNLHPRHPRARGDPERWAAHRRPGFPRSRE